MYSIFSLSAIEADLETITAKLLDEFKVIIFMNNTNEYIISVIISVQWMKIRLRY